MIETDEFHPHCSISSRPDRTWVYVNCEIARGQWLWDDRLFLFFLLRHAITYIRGVCASVTPVPSDVIDSVSPLRQRRLKMKPLIHTAAGETALIAFLIHLAGWCLAGPSAGGGQDFTRTIAPSNWSGNATIHPIASLLSALVEGGSGTTSDNEAGDNGAALRKRRSVNSIYNGRSPLSTMTMMRVQASATYAVESSSPAAAVPAVVVESVVKRVSLGLLLPHTTFRVREYSKAVQTAMNSLRKQDLSFINSYRFQVSDIHTDMLKVNPSPTGKDRFN